MNEEVTQTTIEKARILDIENENSHAFTTY